MDKAIITTSWDDGHPLDLKLANIKIPMTKTNFFASQKHLLKMLTLFRFKEKFLW